MTWPPKWRRGTRNRREPNLVLSRPQNGPACEGEALHVGMAQAHQPTLFDAPQTLPPDAPEGFIYRPEFLTHDEEANLAAWLATLPFAAFQFRGYEGRRRVVSFGWQYDFNRSHLLKADDIPAELRPSGRAPPRSPAMRPKTCSRCCSTSINLARRSAGTATGRSSPRWWGSACSRPVTSASGGAGRPASSGRQ